MWLALAFVSATFLGLYDTSKKASLKDNAVLPVLLLNTIFSTIIFLPFLIDYVGGFGWFAGTFLDTAPFQLSKSEAQLSTTQHITQSASMAGKASKTSILLTLKDLGLTHLALKAHLLVVLKAFIVLSSWICGYFGLKHLPLTIVGPINSTRPVLVLVGAMLIFGERLNAYQWTGVVLAIASIFLMSRAGKKENIDFKSNKWVYILFGAVIMGAVSGLYDKFIMKQLPPLFVQSWFNVYQVGIMGTVLLVMNRFTTAKFQWRWWIPMISLFVSIADFAYFYALSFDDALIAVISMIRRGSVIVSFAAGALLFREKNLKSKALDLVLILIGLALLCWGSIK